MKIKLIILSLFVYSLSYGQAGRVQATSVDYKPGDTATTPKVFGRTILNASDSTQYIFNGVKWEPTGTGTGGTGGGSDVDLSGYALKYVPQNTQSATNYNLTLTDASTIVRRKLAVDNTVTIPNNSLVPFPNGTQIGISMDSTGYTSVIGASGVTIIAPDNITKLRTKGSLATVLKTATNTWQLVGDLYTPGVNASLTSANNYFDDGGTAKTGIAYRNADSVINGLSDPYTGEAVTYTKITGVTDANIDGVIIRKKGSEYFKRNFTDAVDVKWFGAKGNGLTNDSAAVKAWFKYCINNQKAALLSAGVYNVTGSNPFATNGAGVQVFGIDMAGEGKDASIIKISGGYTGKSVFDFNLVKRFNIHDIGVFNTDTTGTAFTFGKTANVITSNIDNVQVQGFDTAFFYGNGYSNVLNNVTIYGVRNGLILNGNAVTINNISIELASKYAIDISNLLPAFYNSAIVFNGGTIQSSKVGLKIRKTAGLVLNAVYFEENGSTILAGTDAGDEVGSLTINGGEFSNNDIIVIDRVGYFSMMGTGSQQGYGSNIKNIKITPNCQYVNIPPQLYNYNYTIPSLEEYINNENKNRQTSSPFWFYDFRDVIFPGATSANTNVDKAGNIYLWTENGTIKDTSDYQTGGNAIVFRATPGQVVSRLFLSINGSSVPKADYLNLTYSAKLGASDLAYDKVVVINYIDNSNNPQSYNSVVSSPSLGSFAPYLSKWVTSSIPINIKDFKANAVGGVSSITGVLVYFRIVSGNNSTGAETLTLDNIGLYPAMYANNMHTDNLFSSITPYESNPEYLNVKKGATFSGQVTIPNATNSTSAVNLSQLNTKKNIADSTDEVSGYTTLYQNSKKLSLSGGLMTGTLNGTNAIFSSDITSRDNVISDGDILTGKIGSGTGGKIRFIDDGGTQRWLSGISGFTGNRDFSVYDIINARDNLTINYQTGKAAFYNSVSAARATTSNELVTKGQLDSLAGPIAIDKKVLTDANYTVLSTDHTLILPEPTSNRILTLPAASTMVNKELWIVCRSTTTGRWILSGSFFQKGSLPSSENFVNSGLVNGVTYHLVSADSGSGYKWYDIND